MALESYNIPSLKLISNVSTADSFSPMKTNHSYLMNLYDCLKNTLIHFCHLVSEYLDSLDNVYDLLVEYTTRVKIIKSTLYLKNYSGRHMCVVCLNLKEFLKLLRTYSIKSMKRYMKDIQVFPNSQYGDL